MLWSSGKLTWASWTEWTSIPAEMKDFQFNLQAHMDVALKREPEWTEEQFQAGVAALRIATDGPAHLWKILAREGQMVEIQAPR